MPLKFDEWRGSFDGRPALLIKRLICWAGCKIQLHKMVRADDPGCFHTHPAWAIRIVLWGGYIEERGDGTFRTWWPGRVGIVRPELEHRIAGLRNGRSSYSLWLRGRKCRKIQLRGYPTEKPKTEPTIHYAMIDPNWGRRRVLVGTVRESEQDAWLAGMLSPEISLYSGYSALPLPSGTRGSQTQLESYGFDVRPVRIEILDAPEGSHD